MPKICYIPKRFSSAHVRMIEQAIAILEEYEAQGFNLTLRALYYKFVSRGLLDNKQKEYKRLGKIVNNARLAGYIDWDSIEDRTRELRGVTHWEDPQQIIDNCARSYRVDKWDDQPCRVEVWVEKDAVLGMIERVCVELDVDFFSCRGYTSQSELWNAAMRMHSYAEAGQAPHVLHLGDHDPSGMDMTRDIFDRFELFMGGLEVNRLALNMDQVQQYNPPPNPTKPTDSRYKTYASEYGDECWELDALEPKVMEDLIRKAVLSVRNERKWKRAVAREKTERQQLAEIAASLNLEDDG